MPDVGDTAPDFTAPLAHGDGDTTEFSLSDVLADEAPVVLAFFPGAFTPPCKQEMAQFQNDIDQYRELGATLYGVSVDSPFAQNAFRDENGFEFGMVSDTNKEIIADYDVSIDMADIGYHGLANRAVFVVDADGEITYKWVADEPADQPDFDAVEEAVEAAA
ncbi:MULTISPECIES: redoxin domain-containing protein [Salinibaculum]|uniref:redoxin domain-containing protein n=1 Tax=Salinibaculum TaxID=2732368 RepID=UPI0030D1150E